jgi:8-oxo-dGTP pyrophosphatase MutT (NUDIX family)
VTLTLSEIEARLAAYTPHRPAGLDDGAVQRRAAVAIILREGQAPVAARDTEILFIRRAEKHGDPWSGHMAFPGGHVDPGDASFLHAAIRETREEIGIDLVGCGEHIGMLEPQGPALRRPGSASLLVAPFVFRLRDPVVCVPNDEVAEVVWTPLTPILRAYNHVEEARIVEGAERALSGYQVGDSHLVWGLTYRMLHSFFAVVDPDWREPLP